MFIITCKEDNSNEESYYTMDSESPTWTKSKMPKILDSYEECLEILKGDFFNKKTEMIDGSIYPPIMVRTGKEMTIYIKKISFEVFYKTHLSGKVKKPTMDYFVL